MNSEILPLSPRLRLVRVLGLSVIGATPSVRIRGQRPRSPQRGIRLETFRPTASSPSSPKNRLNISGLSIQEPLVRMLHIQFPKIDEVLAGFDLKIQWQALKKRGVCFSDADPAAVQGLIVRSARA